MRILIVDDEPHILSTFSFCLEAEGYYVDTARDGAEGLTKFGKGPWDVVILDIRMPRIDGVEVLRKIKKNSPNTVVIMITAFGNSEVEEKVKKMGANGYLNKPLSPKDIREAIRESMRGSK
jgi:DNA-binding response OmpR family regulator